MNTYTIRNALSHRLVLSYFLDWLLIMYVPPESNIGQWN